MDNVWRTRVRVKAKESPQAIYSCALWHFFFLFFFFLFFTFVSCFEGGNNKSQPQGRKKPPAGQSVKSFLLEEAPAQPFLYIVYIVQGLLKKPGFLIDQPEG